MTAPPATRSRRAPALLALGGLVVAASQATGMRALDGEVGDPQVVLALHASAAATAFAGFLAVFLAGVGYLRTRRVALDLLGAAAAEVSAVLAGLAVALGAIWSRSTAGLWWTWTPLLTTVAVTFVLLGGYLVLRAFVEEGPRRGRWSAAVGVLGFLNVPVVFVAIRSWSQAAPAPAAPSPGLRDVATFLAVLVLLTMVRYRIGATGERIRAAVEERALVGGTVHV